MRIHLSALRASGALVSKVPRPHGRGYTLTALRAYLLRNSKPWLFRYNRDRFDFDHQIVVCEFRDLHERACRSILSIVLRANGTERLHLREVRNERRDFYQVIERSAARSQRGL